MPWTPRNLARKAQSLRAATRAAQRESSDEAAVVRLIGHCGIRVGHGRGSTAGQPTFGATTLQGRHWDGKSLSFVGKSGVRNVCGVTDPSVTSALGAREAGPRDALFATTAGRVNRWLRRYRLTAKDFRTVGSNMAFARALAPDSPCGGLATVKQRVRCAVDRAAERLSHRPATARRSYLSAQLLQAAREGWTPDASETAEAEVTDWARHA